jgi:hypothetical protein
MHSASSASASSSRQPIPVPAALERVVTLDGADLAEAAVAPTIVKTGFETGSDIDLTDPDLTDLDRNPEIETRLAPLHIRIINFVAVVLPFLGLVAAMVLLWGTAFSWVYLAMLVGGTILTGLGVTVGYHRLFTHRSFRTVRPGRPRLDGRAGPRRRMGRHPSQAPSAQRRRSGPAFAARP